MEREGGEMVGDGGRWRVGERRIKGDGVRRRKR